MFETLSDRLDKVFAGLRGKGRLTAAITGGGLDVTSARIETLGADAVDCFYVCNPSGTPVDAEQRARVDEALVAATRGAPAPEAVDTPG